MCAKLLQSCLTLCDPVDRHIAHQAPLSMGFHRKEDWSGLPFPSPRDLPNPGIKPVSPALQADSLPSEPPGKLFECLFHERVLVFVKCFSASIEVMIWFYLLLI